jgi:hypothetical protein
MFDYSLGRSPEPVSNAPRQNFVSVRRRGERDAKKARSCTGPAKKNCREKEIRRNNIRWCDETKMRTHSSSAVGNWPHFPELDWRAALGVEHE